jgi:RNA polymerase sigma-70 factor, ECF subfamily
MGGGNDMQLVNLKRQQQFKNDMMPYADALFNYGLYLSGDREQASDLLQETYLKAYRFFDKFEQGTNAKAWLYRIMKNTFINEYRRTHRQPEIVQFDEQISPYQMNSYSEGMNDLRDKMESRMFDDEMAGAIAELPEKFKSVIVLRDIEEMPYEEIAKLLSIPIGTVRSRLHRARSILFTKLKDYASARGYTVGDRFVPSELAMAG